MMRKITYNIVAVSLVFSMAPHDGAAQVLSGFGRKLEKKVEQQINKRVERQADKAIEKGMDKVENAAEDALKGNGKKDANAEADSPAKKGRAGFPMGGGDVTLLDSYAFGLGITYQIESGKGKPMETAMWFGNEEYIGMSVAQQKDVFMVMHDANMIAFMEKEKSYMVIGGGMAASVLGAAADEAEHGDGIGTDFSIKKIGTERILDHVCDVYEASTPEYTTKLWLTTELGVEAGHFMRAFGQLTKSSMGNFPDLKNQAGGVLLKMEGKSLENNDTMRMEATAIQKQGKRIDTKGYKSFGL